MVGYQTNATAAPSITGHDHYVVSSMGPGIPTQLGLEACRRAELALIPVTVSALLSL